MRQLDTREEAENFMLEFCRSTNRPIISRSTELEVIRVLAGYIQSQRAKATA